MANKPTVARATRPNAGLKLKYQRDIEGMIKEMHRSTVYWLQAAYRANPPRVAVLAVEAQDAAMPALSVLDSLNELRQRWFKFFADHGRGIAKRFATRAFAYGDKSFESSLKDAGWAVKLKLTPAMNDALTASIEGNVGLIRSIPSHYHDQVQEIVMRNYAAGRQINHMIEELEALYPKAKRRARFIAEDQSNKIHAVTTQARQLELGIKEAIWMHSHGGKVPRPDHVAADGRKYNVAEGCLISGKHILPGELPRCRCLCRSVFPFEVAV